MIIDDVIQSVWNLFLRLCVLCVWKHRFNVRLCCHVLRLMFIISKLFCSQSVYCVCTVYKIYVCGSLVFRGLSAYSSILDLIKRYSSFSLQLISIVLQHAMRWISLLSRSDALLRLFWLTNTANEDRVSSLGCQRVWKLLACLSNNKGLCIEVYTPLQGWDLHMFLPTVLMCLKKNVLSTAWGKRIFGSGYFLAGSTYLTSVMYAH